MMCLLKILHVWKISLCVINDYIVEKIFKHAQLKTVCVVTGRKNIYMKLLPCVAKVI